MRIEEKTRKQLIKELTVMLQRVADLEKSDAQRKLIEDQLRESERRLSDIIDFLPDATLVIDRKGRVIAQDRLSSG